MVNDDGFLPYNDQHRGPCFGGASCPLQPDPILNSNAMATCRYLLWVRHRRLSLTPAHGPNNVSTGQCGHGPAARPICVVRTRGMREG